MGRPLVRRLLAAAITLVAVLGVGGAGAGPGRADTPGPLQLVSIGSFDAPVYVTAPAGDASRLFIVEKAGEVILQQGGVTSTFLDIRSRVISSGTEQGLFSIAFDPNFATNGLFYADYTSEPDGNLEVDEFHATGNTVDGGPRVVLTIPHASAPNHNGGQLQFGPDGYLYIGAGDGGDENDQLGHGQDPTSLLAKILRIDPHQSGAQPYTVPASNPGVSGLRPGWAPEVYAMGLRNPWRFSFDPVTGRLVIGDVGQDMYEEVDDVSIAGGLGANFGWSCFEATHPGPTAATPLCQALTGTTLPVFEYPHTLNRCSITGGVVVRDATLPALAGRYIYGDYCSGALYSFVPPATDGAAATDNEQLDPNVPSLSSFGVDGVSHVYAVSLAGPVYRLFQAGASDSPPVPSFTVTPSPAGIGQTIKLDASASSDPDGRVVAYAWDFNGDGKTDATGATASTSYATAGTHAITLTVTDDGGVSASKTISAVVRAATTSGAGGSTGDGSSGGKGGSDTPSGSSAHLAGTTVKIAASARTATVLRTGLHVVVRSSTRARWKLALLVNPATARHLHLKVPKGATLVTIGSTSRTRLRSGAQTIDVLVKRSVRPAFRRAGTVHVRVRAIATDASHHSATTWHTVVVRPA